jgi:proteasome lid subunit RPN8/RPN11
MSDARPPEGMDARGWTDRTRPSRRTFPGPGGAGGALRVAVQRVAFADLTAHARESLDTEVAGVLVGDLCEDDEGPFLDVQAAVRAAGARQGRGHVTFTQESWNGIHAAIERDHPKRHILGWYHTHPGFGVEFSEMDAFIQRHFFPQPWQVALLTDPLGGELALAVAGPSGLEYLDRFWVEGREQRCRRPGPRAGVSGDVAALEARVAQLGTAVHELRKTLQQFLMAAGIFTMLTLGGVASYAVYRTWLGAVKPPEHIAFVPLPVQLGGRPALIGVSVVRWDIPPELWSVPEPAPRPETPPGPSASPDAAATPAESR